MIPFLRLIDPPPPEQTQSVVSSFEHDVESGRYEKMLKQAAKFDEQEMALLQNEQLIAEWAELSRPVGGHLQGALPQEEPECLGLD